MTTTSVTIAVDPQAAQALAAVSPEDRRKIELLLSLRLRELTVDLRKPLGQIMDEIGGGAEQNGLTADGLTELLHGE